MGNAQTIADPNPEKKKSQQLFTFYDSCSKSLGRFLAGNCNGLRADKKSSWHFDFPFLSLSRDEKETFEGLTRRVPDSRSYRLYNSAPFFYLL